MFKGILLIVIFLACTATGRSISNARRRRYELISEILAAMRVLRLRMLNSLEPLGILMRKSDSPLFRELGNDLWEGSSLADCWQKKRSSERQNMLSCLTTDDLLVLDSFFQNLGSSGLDEQNHLFAQVIEALEEKQILAKKRYQETSRLYTALGSMVGIAICILIV